MKLAVGVASLDAFEERVAQRRAGGMSVWTRSFPKRADHVQSLFWVVSGLLGVRQTVLAIEQDTRDDGSRCTRIDVQPVLIRVAGRPVRPFQGWRYLEVDQAPCDLAASSFAGDLPPALARDLRELCLI